MRESSLTDQHLNLAARRAQGRRPVSLAVGTLPQAGAPISSESGFCTSFRRRFERASAAPDSDRTARRDRRRRSGPAAARPDSQRLARRANRVGGRAQVRTDPEGASVARRNYRSRSQPRAVGIHTVSNEGSRRPLRSGARSPAPSEERHHCARFGSAGSNRLRIRQRQGIQPRSSRPAGLPRNPRCGSS